MPKVSTYTRTRIELLHKQGLHPAGIFTSLKSKGLPVSFSSVTRIIKKLCITGSVTSLPRSGRPQKLSIEAKASIDQQMPSNDEMTSIVVFIGFFIFIFTALPFIILLQCKRTNKIKS